MITVEVRPADDAVVKRLVARTDNEHEQFAELERFAAQERGEGLLLVAWEGDEIRGRVRLRWYSKYVEVIDEMGEFPEINALDAWPQGQRIGTQIIDECERIAVERGDKQMGIAVVVTNVDARRLYERLGYEHWGDVIDRTEYYDDAGNLEHVHEDPCVYLIKNLA